jgi:fatty acid desaturase
MVATRRADHNHAVDDYSGDYAPLRARLMAETGGEYQRFLAGLAPRYARVWTDIGLGYLGLAAVVGLVGLPPAAPSRLVGAVLGALGIGYGVAYIQLYLHEAAHSHLAPDRRLNDWLCDALISWQVGTTVERYRPVHFAHHRHLGTRADTENSYFQPLGPRLILETLAGIHALRILRNRQRQLDRAPAADGGSRAGNSTVLLRGALLHAGVCAVAFAVSGWPGLAAWILSVGACYPLFATLRQLLEHRSTEADPATDYTRTDHGALTRLFGTGPLASTFGGAGFNRHLLHHWEPQVSCTRLGDLENYLQGTSAAPIMAARRSTYLGAFRSLWRRSPTPAVANR